MSDTVEQIKSRLDIVDIVSGYLKTQKSGVNFKARCPFHTEKTPSFYISPERQSWHCFGCNKGGDMFSFVQEIEGIEFVEALRILATRAGVPLPQYKPEDRAEKDQRQRLLGIAELTAKFFEKQLWNSSAGARALAYLRERGLTDDTIHAWRLGWAPNDWRGLTGFLKNEHANNDIVAAGIAIDKNGRMYDRFRSRIMFPICDANGQIVGFTGRAFGAEVAVDGEPPAKYVNTPQTVLYDKSRVLFGLDKAKHDMRTRDACLLVEGNVDAILSWQAGATNVVATSGTALTPYQLRMLARYSTNIDVCFDADAAGQVATRRGIALALAQNFAVRVVTIDDPECKDPADYVQSHGDKWHDVVAAAKPVLQYYYDAAVATFNPASAESKKNIVRMLGPFIKRLASSVERSHWTGQLAMLLRTDQTSVATDIASLYDDLAQYERFTSEETAMPSAVLADPIGLDPLNEEALTLLVRLPELAAPAAAFVDLVDPRVAAIIRDPSVLKIGAPGISDASVRPMMTAAAIRAGEWYADFTPEDCAAQLSVVGARMKERTLRTQCARLESDIRQAELAKDTDRVRALSGEFQECSAEMQRLQSIS